MTSPNRVQRIESAALAFAIVVAHVHAGLAWWWIPTLFLVVDLSLLGYLAGPRIGAATYNVAHAWVGPAATLVAAVLTEERALLIVASAWGFHVALDRAVGYGLKHPTGFSDTHLGRIGRGDARATPPA